MVATVFRPMVEKTANARCFGGGFSKLMEEICSSWGRTRNDMVGSGRSSPVRPKQCGELG